MVGQDLRRGATIYAENGDRSGNWIHLKAEDLRDFSARQTAEHRSLASPPSGVKLASKNVAHADREIVVDCATVAGDWSGGSRWGIYIKTTMTRPGRRGGIRIVLVETCLHITWMIIPSSCTVCHSIILESIWSPKSRWSEC